jgi:3-dehydroquinate dehydratase
MSLKAIRSSDRAWRIGVLAGPNLSRVMLSGGEAAWDQLADQVVTWGEALGVEVVPFQSNHEGRLLEFVHRENAGLDGYLVNPGGLIRFGESLRHVLSESGHPAVEVHLENLPQLGGESHFTASLIGICAGLREHSYLAALTALTLALDDPTFLHPDGDAPTNRKDGKPRSLYGG